MKITQVLLFSFPHTQCLISSVRAMCTTIFCGLPSSTFCAYPKRSLSDHLHHYSHNANNSYFSHRFLQLLTTCSPLCFCPWPVIVSPPWQPGGNFQNYQLDQVTHGFNKWFKHSLRTAFLAILLPTWLLLLRPTPCISSHSLNITLSSSQPSTPFSSLSAH